MKSGIEKIRAVIFDADDTLWVNEPLFRAAEHQFYDILAEFGGRDALAAELYSTEMSNMAELGYGSKAFCLSMIETAVRVSGGRVTAGQIIRIEQAGREIMRNPAVPMPGVPETLKRIRESGRFKTAVLTKGDLLEQRGKLDRSGLMQYFDLVDIVAEKEPEVYADLCRRLGIDASEMLMVGNSFKSDIDPVLKIGGRGVYIPAEMTWQHEIIDEYDHPGLFRASAFPEVADILF
ncbi:MAG: HAD family hydrolase [Candidatus Cryptobacteroides sp.]|nr:HAD family hydrolase [Bacteroidales bacterium]